MIGNPKHFRNTIKMCATKIKDTIKYYLFQGICTILKLTKFFTGQTNCLGGINVGKKSLGQI